MAAMIVKKYSHPYKLHYCIVTYIPGSSVMNGNRAFDYI